MKIRWDKSITLGPVRLLLIIAVAVVGIRAFSQNVYDPVDAGQDLVAGVLSDNSGHCPSGWKPADNSTRDVFDYSCSQLINGNVFIVRLNGKFECDSWINLDTGQNGKGCQEVPEWG